MDAIVDDDSEPAADEHDEHGANDAERDHHGAEAEDGAEVEGAGGRLHEAEAEAGDGEVEDRGADDGASLSAAHVDNHLVIADF